MPRFRTYLPRIHSDSVTAQADEVLNPQEQALYALLAAHPEQQRKFCNLHQTLMAVARGKARDIAIRDYEGHVDPRET
jgi:hypothetical protein